MRTKGVDTAEPVAYNSTIYTMFLVSSPHGASSRGSHPVLLPEMAAALFIHCMSRAQASLRRCQVD